MTTIGVSTVGPQLNTRQKMAKPRLKSLVDSVLPVPAGPAGAAPSLSAIAPVMVDQHLSVIAVMTSRPNEPKYS